MAENTRALTEAEARIMTEIRDTLYDAYRGKQAEQQYDGDPRDIADSTKKYEDLIWLTLGCGGYPESVRREARRLLSDGWSEKWTQDIFNIVGKLSGMEAAAKIMRLYTKADRIYVTSLINTIDDLIAKCHELIEWKEW